MVGAMVSKFISRMRGGWKGFRPSPAGVVAAALIWLVTGCVGPKIDWNGRIGNYTYDQAVLELGPPDKYAKVTDGSIVADWLTRRGRSGGYVTVMGGGPYYYPYYGGPGTVYATDASSPDYFLRLTFGPDGRLLTWKKFAR